MDDDRDLDEDIVELADARLEWAKDARCLDIPEQATALRWHATACEEARDAVIADRGARK
jgi:hypothetical protein